MSFLNLAVVGVGLVGSELLTQIAQPSLASKFRLVYLSSSRKALHGNISLASWKQDLETSSSPPALDTLPQSLQQLAQSTGQPVVLVDNTSSDAVAARYPVFLNAGIHVVTPNKKAYSSDLSLYEEIIRSSQASGAKFLNEATVGAGLPIISTLKDLIATGDKVRPLN
jgi:homoserine dehydrogenase